jgi:hypothetical protein
MTRIETHPPQPRGHPTPKHARGVPASTEAGRASGWGFSDAMFLDGGGGGSAEPLVVFCRPSLGIWSGVN